jgi:hypothetical protein
MQTISFELPKLLRLVKDDRFQIPQFQRPFRWRSSQIKLLIDSIVRGYPIGSLLVMGKHADLPLKARSIEASILGDDGESAGSEDESQLPDTQLVLDGQQRITSIARAFLNADPKRSYYFDLKEMLDTFSNPEESETDVPWIKSYQKGQKDPERKNKNRWIRADVILDSQKSSIFTTEYIEDSGEFDSVEKTVRRQHVAKLSGLFEVVRKYQIPIVSIDADVGLESVCRVFETINSTGTRLTTFDLAVARFFPDPDLRALLETSKERHAVLKEFDVDGDRILQVLALMYAHDQRRSPEPSRSALLQLPSTFVRTKWPLAADALAGGLRWAKEQGARADTLPSTGLVVSIAGLLALRPGLLQDIQANFSSVLRRWYFSRVLREGATGGANTRIAQDFADLVAHVFDGKPLSFQDVLMTVENILKLTSSQDNRYKAIQCIISLSAKEDLVTQQVITDESELEHHHIFPRAHAKTNAWKHRVDSVANVISVLKSSNRKISDKQPSEYLGALHQTAIKNGIVSDLRRRFDFSLLPFGSQMGQSAYEDSLALERFDEFVESRASIIHKKIGELIGASLVDKDGAGDSELDQDEKTVPAT